MTDLALVPGETSADFAIANNDLVADDGLDTSIYLSLFCDRRAGDEDVLPLGETDRRGFYGDDVPLVANDRLGSRLWMLKREKQTNETLARAKEYAEEALAWLTQDKAASVVTVATSYPQTGVMLISLTIEKPTTDPVRFDYNYTWAAQKVKRG